MATASVGLVWTKQVPTEVGWYWYRETAEPVDLEPMPLQVRDYAGDLAIGNCVLRKEWLERRGVEWAGPIRPPTARRR